MRKAKTLPPHSWEVHPLADKGEVNKSLVIVLITVAVLIVLVLLLFFGKQFVGKAYGVPENTAGIFTTTCFVGEECYLPILASLTESSVAVEFDLSYDSTLNLNCESDVNLLAAKMNDRFVISGADLRVVNQVTCAAGQVNFRYAGLCADTSCSNALMNGANPETIIAEIKFTPATIGTYNFDFSNLKIYGLDGNLLVDSGRDATITVAERSECQLIGQLGCNTDSADGSLQCVGEELAQTFCISAACSSAMDNFDVQVLGSAYECTSDANCVGQATCMDLFDGLNTKKCIDLTNPYILDYISEVLTNCLGAEPFCQFKDQWGLEKCAVDEGNCHSDTECATGLTCTGSLDERYAADVKVCEQSLPNVEICDGTDNNGDGETDEGLTNCCNGQIVNLLTDNNNCGACETRCLSYDCVNGVCGGVPPTIETNCNDGIDEDQDTALDCLDTDCSASTYCLDSDNDGTNDAEDCDDTDPLINTAATEICDNKDNDCDGLIDDDVTRTTALGGVCIDQSETCIGGVWTLGVLIANYESTETNCADVLDNDCDNAVDCQDADCAALELCQLPPTCADVDNDNYSATNRTDCAPLDCNDGNANVWVNVNGYLDADSDRYGAGTVNIFCTNGSLPASFVANNLDCNSQNANINPGKTEICGNGVDEDCSGTDAECVIIEGSSSSSSSGGGGRKCTSQWQCTSWSYCNASLLQTRTCTDLKRCDYNKPTKIETQNCSSCEESWSCSLWSNCVNGINTRTCTDEHACGTMLLKPDLQKYCQQVAAGPAPSYAPPTYQPPVQVQEPQSTLSQYWEQYKSWIIAIPMGLLLLIVIILLLLHVFRPKPHLVYDINELKDWIGKERAAGTSDADISSLLKEHTGWSDNEINQAFSGLKA